MIFFIYIIILSLMHVHFNTEQKVNWIPSVVNVHCWIFFNYGLINLYWWMCFYLPTEYFYHVLMNGVFYLPTEYCKHVLMNGVFYAPIHVEYCKHITDECGVLFENYKLLYQLLFTTTSYRFTWVIWLERHFFWQSSLCHIRDDIIPTCLVC